MPGNALAFLIFGQSLAASIVLAHLPTAPLVLDDACPTNSRCEQLVRYSYCLIASPTCGQGKCTCWPGFVPSVNGSECARVRKIGDRCSGSDVCADPNSRCINGVCMCDSGFHTITETGVCTNPHKTKRAGEQCFDSTDCIGELRCVDNKCGCYPEYSQSGCCKCVSKTYGDFCRDISDCLHASHTICLRLEFIKHFNLF